MEVLPDEELFGLIADAMKKENPYFYVLSILGCKQVDLPSHGMDMQWVIGEEGRLHSFIRFVEIMYEAKKGQEIFDAGRESVFLEMEMDMQKSKTSTRH